MKAPLLSACIIARDEEERLPRCLASLAGVADEIVVVDTGSKDRTVEIAREAGARVCHFEWCDDFAAARNTAVDAATGQWVLSIDADEWIEPAGRPIDVLALTDSTIAYRVTIENRLDDGRIDRERVTRLFRRLPGIRYSGRIHEQVTHSVALEVSAGRGRWLDLDDWTLLHDGYQGAVMRAREKGARNIKLLEKALNEDPSDSYLRYKLAMELGMPAGQSQLRLVLDSLVDASAAELACAPWAERALLNGALAMSQVADHDRAVASVTRAERSYGTKLEVLLVRGKVLEDKGDVQGALAALARAHERFPQSEKPLHALMRLALAMGDARSALQLGAARLGYAPGDAVTLELCACAAESLGDRATAAHWRAAIGA